VQAAADTRLPAWTAADRPIENTDVLLWYLFGIHPTQTPARKGTARPCRMPSR
jgi:primary-amine oxidase